MLHHNELVVVQLLTLYVTETKKGATRTTHHHMPHTDHSTARSVESPQQTVRSHPRVYMQLFYLQRQVQIQFNVTDAIDHKHPVFHRHH